MSEKNPNHKSPSAPLGGLVISLRDGEGYEIKHGDCTTTVIAERLPGRYNRILLRLIAQPLVTFRRVKKLELNARISKAKLS